MKFGENNIWSQSLNGILSKSMVKQEIDFLKNLQHKTFTVYILKCENSKYFVGFSQKHHIPLK